MGRLNLFNGLFNYVEAFLKFMKTILLTKEKRKEIVFTPETEFEEKLIELFGEGLKEAKIYLGEFYDCQGGWLREGNSKNSLIVVFDEKSK